MKHKKRLLAAVVSLSLVAGLITPLAQVNAEGELPSTFDLRDRGVVTSVKNQGPWGTCWAHGASAAAEITILSQLGLTSEQFREKYGEELDFSEKHLGWWTYHAVPRNDKDDKSQAGEGVYIFNENLKNKVKRNAAYDLGGVPLFVTSMYSSGIGPVTEKGALRYGGYKRGKRSFDTDADWTLKDNTRGIFTVELKDGNLLPSPAILEDLWNENGYAIYKGYNPAGTEAIKKELLKGRGVTIGYEADVSMPEDLGNGKFKSEYMSENWAQYKDEDIALNHMVCIVGWDDNYPVANFNEKHQPPAPGAWLVKNSWGSGYANPDSHAYFDEWGIEGEDGKHTGYFWLSYYDHSISIPESFSFMGPKKKLKEMIVGQYDFLQGGQTMDGGVNFNGKRERKMANVFMAPKDMRLSAVGTDTYKPNTTVRFDVYKVDADYTSTPNKGTRIATKTVTFPYAGYHRVELDRSHVIKKGDYYSVIVTEHVKTKKGKKYIANVSYGYGKELSKKNGLGYYSKAVVNRGESFLGYARKDGTIKWVDWLDVLKESREDDRWLEKIEFDNFAIKAFSYPVK